LIRTALARRPDAAGRFGNGGRRGAAVSAIARRWLMQAVVIFDTQFGNTEQVARAIARGLADHASVDVLAATTAMGRPDSPPDLLLIGGPTQRHGMSPALAAYVDALPRAELQNTRVATFDTRYRIAPLLSGSAARDAAGRLRRSGLRLIAAPESFFIERDRPPDGENRRHGSELLEAGELERARAWGQRLASLPR
jgi:flavodoxin